MANSNNGIYRAYNFIFIRYHDPAFTYFPSQNSSPFCCPRLSPAAMISRNKSATSLASRSYFYPCFALCCVPSKTLEN